MNSWLNTGGGESYNRPAIPAGEIVRGRFFVALLKFGFSATGAEMLFTDRYLILSPVDTGAARAILKALAGVAGVPGAKDLVIKVEQTGLTEPIQISADSIQHVEPLGDGSAAAPPAVRITFANTGTIDLGVLYTKHAVNFDPRNRQARDAAVAWLRRLAASTSTAPLGAPQPNTSGVAAHEGCLDTAERAASRYR